MSDVTVAFRQYARLDQKRGSTGLTISELEQWSRLKAKLDRRFAGSTPAGLRDRRRSVRVPTRLLCVFASKSEFAKAVITNLSSNGVFISTTSPFAVGTKLRLRIRVENTGADVEVSGEVVSNHVGPDLRVDESGMGVRFAKLPPEVADRISELYANELGRHGDDAATIDRGADTHETA